MHGQNRIKFQVKISMNSFSAVLSLIPSDASHKSLDTTLLIILYHPVNSYYDNYSDNLSVFNHPHSVFSYEHQVS